MSLGKWKTDCEIKSYGGVKTPTDLDLTEINQARRLSPHVIDGVWAIEGETCATPSIFASG